MTPLQVATAFYEEHILDILAQHIDINCPNAVAVLQKNVINALATAWASSVIGAIEYVVSSENMTPHVLDSPPIFN